MKTVRRLLTFLLAFRWLIILAILLGCIMVVSNMLLLGMAAYLIAEAALMPLMVMLVLPSAIVRLMSLSRSASRYGERLLSHNVTFRLLARLRADVYSRLEPLAPAHVLTYGSSDILTRLSADIEELQNLYLRAVAPILVALIISLLTFYAFAIFSPLLAWVAFAFLMVTGLGIPLLVGLLTRTIGKRQLALRAELRTLIVDDIQGVQDILAYGQAGRQQDRLAELDAQLASLQRRMALIAGLRQALTTLMSKVALWSLLALAIPLVTTKAINGVYLGCLALLILASFEAIQPLGQAFQSLGHSLAAGKRLFELVDAQPTITAPAEPLPAPEGRLLSFEHVSFAYGPGEAEILHDITLSIASGQRIALVGPSGTGKSTLARLALRFWDPTEGTVRIDGQDMRQYQPEDIRACISMVDQDTYLFNDTVRGNILLGNPNASSQEIEQALETAQLGTFVRQLPQGLDTWVGEQGLRLSGGERQRVAIARALLKNAPLLILDEVTANLDSQTEQELLQALTRLMGGRTTLMMTHRLINMEEMDEIIVLDQGRIRERGTHTHLLMQDGLYRRLFDIQNGMLTFG
ncbi:thiol reductant ABC exporter subunit CydC [Dictyobacter alpinus]|uniref:Thiol reductant ABC exporter subunit CydC n=1 Tax=Dictyobacter alpinus TaxID=2014873 RepID=A0A402BEP2_9CHLR|nr:thiol reductant ABC exporter subunit CydC [Dictyobacter alpinus]GCE29901.1 thiol reductant ABC exporter subunit CydC [Dictyobacter alpinus]